LNRGTSEIIVLAADTAPLAILLHLPLLCEGLSFGFTWVYFLTDFCSQTRMYPMCMSRVRGEAALSSNMVISLLNLVCSALGRACGVSRAVISASITTNEASDLQNQIRGLKDKVERLMI